MAPDSPGLGKRCPVRDAPAVLGPWTATLGRDTGSAALTGGDQLPWQARSSPHLPYGGSQATRDLDGEVVYEVLDDVSPVVASGHGHRGDSGQPERLQDRPGSVPWRQLGASPAALAWGSPGVAGYSWRGFSFLLTFRVPGSRRYPPPSSRLAGALEASGHLPASRSPVTAPGGELRGRLGRQPKCPRLHSPGSCDLDSDGLPGMPPEP